MAIHKKIVNPRSGGGTATTDASELVTGILANARLGTGIPVAKLADGSVSDEELQYLDGLTNDLVTLLAAKADASHTHSYDTDDISESLTKKYVSTSEKAQIADSFQKSSDNLDNISESLSRKHYTTTDKGKVDNLDANATMNTDATVSGMSFIKYGTFTKSAGPEIGSPDTVTFAITGVKAGDVAIVNSDYDAEGITVGHPICSANTVSITFYDPHDLGPSFTDATFNVIVLRKTA